MTEETATESEATERAARAGDDEALPPFGEQVAEQIGGWRGLLESSIPVAIFVALNIITELRPAIIGSVAVALAIAVWRLTQRKPIRYALNGVFGIVLGAVIAWNSGAEKDFYLPGILITVGYGLALLISVAVRQPLVGWIWSVVANKGKSDWRQNARLSRAFMWLTVGWAAVYLAKALTQWALWAADMATVLGISRIVLGFPPYAILLALTIWAARRIIGSEPAAEAPQMAGMGVDLAAAAELAAAELMDAELMDAELMAADVADGDAEPAAKQGEGSTAPAERR